MNRSVMLGLLALVVVAPGCAGTTKRGDGVLSIRPGAWADAPAPAQTQVALPPERTDVRVVSTATPTPAAPSAGQGLSKYFPGFRREPSAAPSKLASYRPSWFGLRRPPKEVQTYMTDARAGLNRGPVEPSLLPVGLQVPTDGAVRTVAAEGPAIEPSPSPSPDSAQDKPVDRMPEVPAIDPRERPRMAAAPAPPVVEPAPAGDAPQEKAVETEEPADDKAEEKVVDKADEKAVRAAPAPVDLSNSLGLPEATLPASYHKHETMAAPGHSTVGPVLASPQVQPTSRVAPSPQAGAKPAAEAKTGQRPCLRRVVRKVCHLGEFADPPTAKPH